VAKREGCIARGDGDKTAGAVARVCVPPVWNRDQAATGGAERPPLNAFGREALRGLQVEPGYGFERTANPADVILDTA
jgi:hypothetical protein